MTLVFTWNTEDKRTTEDTLPEAPYKRTLIAALRNSGVESVTKKGVSVEEVHVMDGAIVYNCTVNGTKHEAAIEFDCFGAVSLGDSGELS